MLNCALIYLALARAGLFGAERAAHGMQPFYRDADGYFVQKNTRAVFANPVARSTSSLPGTSGSETASGSAKGSSSSSSSSSATGKSAASTATTAQPPSSSVPVFRYRPLRNAAGWTLPASATFKAAEEEKHAQRYVFARVPTRVDLDDDVLIAVGGVPPLNPMYRDRSNFRETYSSEFSNILNGGWVMSGRLRSRSKRCANFTCPVATLGSLSGLSECLERSAPGCVLDVELALDLAEQGSVCCYDAVDSEEMAERYYVSNYTWFLPTPPLAVDLALAGNVSTFARFWKQEKSGLHSSSGERDSEFLSGGFGVSKMNGACADYRPLEIQRHAAKVANPSTCFRSKLDGRPEAETYIDCHGWPATAGTRAFWNKTGARQLLFNAVINDTNCLTAAAQYKLLTARLTVGATVYAPRAARARAPSALDFGYREGASALAIASF